MLASYYTGYGGGSCGNLQDGRFHFAELGVAGNYGLGAADGRGNMAIDLGLEGQLPCGAGGWIRYHGKATYATKADVGYGDVHVGPNLPNQRRIDLYDRLAYYLGMTGVDYVEFAPNYHTIPQASQGLQGRATYVNPIAHAHVTPERIDQGVDYAGTGSYVALADGRVSLVAPGAWAPYGNFVEYEITTEGQFKGAFVYYAEGIEAVVHEGQHVLAGEEICRLIPGWHSGTEIGFSSGDGQAHTYYAYHDGRYVEGTATRPGIAFSRLIEHLGGHGGIIEGSIVGNWPEYMPNGEISSTVLPSLPAGEPIFTGLSPQGASDYAHQLEWGRYLKRNFLNLDKGASYGAHWSSLGRQFATSTTYIDKAEPEG